MKKQDYTANITVNATAQEAFNAINNVRGWWSEEIEGSTKKLNDEFTYHYEDVHRCKMKLIEVVPNKKVVWQVLDNYFNFTKDKSEWKGTKIIFEISKKDNKTQIHFTHLGLVPEYECYEICQDAWSNYIKNSLRSLIMTGKGQPNATGNPKTENEKKLGSAGKKQDFTASITVNATAQEAFNAINNVRGWWTGEPGIEGSTDKLGDEFTYRYNPYHFSKQKITEFIPGKKVVWHVLDANLSFVKDKNEWKDTDIVFEIAKKGDKTEVRFTHVGLVPEYECYDDCSNAWGSYIKSSLRNLIITTGKGRPITKEGKTKAAKKIISADAD